MSVSVLCLLLLIVAVVSAQEPNCPGSTVPLISGPRYSLSFEQFSSSSDYSDDYRPFHAKTNLRNSWCPLQSQAGGWLQVDFGVEVTIHELQIGGDGGFFQYYLETFTLQYGPNETSLTAILEPNSNTAMVFSRPSTADIRTTNLPQPITTRVLRIQAVSYQGDVPCVLLEAIGCVLQPDPCNDSVVSLSSNRTLLPLTGVTASSETDNLAIQVLNTPGSIGWCSEEVFNPATPSPYIIFNFTQPVIVSHMISAGGDDEYVTEFSLDYREEYNSEYKPYTILTSQEAEFSTEDGGTATHTFWNQPLEGVTFRFKILDGVGDPVIFCWNAELFGCAQNDQDNPPTMEVISTTTQSTSAESESSSTLANDPTTSSPVTMTTSQVVVTGASTGLIAGVSAAGVVAVLIIVLLVLLIIVCAVLKSRNSKTVRMREVAYSEARGVRIVDNDVYGKETPPTSPTLKQSEAEENNTYESVKTPPHNPADLNVYAAIGSPNVKPSIDQYEPVESPGLYTYAMVDTPVKVSLAHDDKRQSNLSPSSNEGINSEFKVGSLSDNAAYGSNLALRMSTEAIEFQPSEGTAFLGIESHDIAVSSNDMEDVNNPMYGTKEVTPIVDNPMYTTSTEN